MAEIQLSNGGVALIDDIDVPLVSGRVWRRDDHQHPNVYACYRPRNKGVPNPRLFMHRLVMQAPPGTYIDHINGNGLDNRRENLRIASNSQNQANRRRLPLNTSGFKGVCWNKASQRWQAGIKHNLKSYHLGLFETPEQAAAAYDEAAKRFFGEFAFTNEKLKQEVP